MARVYCIHGVPLKEDDSHDCWGCRVLCRKMTNHEHPKGHVCLYFVDRETETEPGMVAIGRMSVRRSWRKLKIGVALMTLGAFLLGIPVLLSGSVVGFILTGVTAPTIWGLAQWR